MKTTPIHPNTARPILAAIPATVDAGLKKPLPGKSRWLMPLAILCCMVNAVSADQFGDFTYTDNGTTITITDYPTGAVGAVDIPATIIGKPVTIIGSSAFQSCHGLTDVTIPVGVTSIGNSAFSYCTGLTSVTIPGGVTSIGNFAFSYCSSLTSAIFAGNAPTMGVGVFGNAASGFKVGYYSGASEFTAPTWTDSSGYIYPSVNLGPSPSATWLVSNGMAASTNLLDTPNDDGVSLLMAYALNLDPTKNQAANLPKAAVTGGNLSYTYHAGNTDVCYQVQASADLKIWSAAGVSVSTPDGNGNCTASVPLASGLRYLRLVVSH